MLEIYITTYSLSIILLMILVIYRTRRGSSRRTNILPFRTYHRIEYLRKKRAKQAQKRDKK